MNEELRSIRVSIFGRDYNIKGGSDEDYIRNLAEYVDSVMKDIADNAGALSSGRIAILAALNIADEMHKNRQRFHEFTDKIVQKLQSALDVDQRSNGLLTTDPESEDIPNAEPQSPDSE